MSSSDWDQEHKWDRRWMCEWFYRLDTVNLDRIVFWLRVVSGYILYGIDNLRIYKYLIVWHRKYL